MTHSQFDQLWQCIHTMQNLCARNDISSAERKDLEETITFVYDKLTDMVYDLHVRDIKN